MKPTEQQPLGLLASRLWPAVALSAGLVTVASAGYVVLAEYSWFDAVYMTVITLGTIGYQEIQPLDAVGRAWTIGVVVAGFCLLIYVASVLTALFVSDDLGRAMRARKGAKMRDDLRDHIIVVGFGRVGAAAARAVQAERRPCVVIDVDVTRIDGIETTGALALVGDGREEAALRAAGIERAAALVAAAHDDASNLVVVLTARSLRPDLRIVARVNDSAWSSRMTRAGADVAASPYDSVGASLATSAIESSVISRHDLPGLGLRTEEIEVQPESAAIGCTLRELAIDQPDVLLLGLRDVAGLSGWQAVTGALSEGDIVVALGAPDALTRLAHRLASPERR